VADLETKIYICQRKDLAVRMFLKTRKFINTSSHRIGKYWNCNFL